MRVPLCCPTPTPRVMPHSKVKVVQLDSYREEAVIARLLELLKSGCARVLRWDVSMSPSTCVLYGRGGFCIGCLLPVESTPP
jgi:hypothetical protein